MLLKTKPPDRFGGVRKKLDLFSWEAFRRNRQYFVSWAVLTNQAN